MESKKINQLATELAPDLSDLTIIGDPTTGISKKITLSQMASLFTGTVEEYANLAAFPITGVADTIYIALDTNVIYRWDSTSYVVLSPNIIASLVFSDANGFDGNISLVGSVATLTITTALTSGSVPFIGASGALTQDNSNLFFDDTNNRLGIATALPTTPLDVFGSGIIGRLNATSTNNAYLGFASNGTNKWSAGNVQSDHRFRIFSEANSAELITILQTGEFGIGISNPTTKFHIDGAASALIANLDANVSIAKSVSFRSDNSARINLEVSGTESGSNAGADLFIKRFSDAGALIDTPLTITRSTGLVTIPNLSFTTLTGIVPIANGGTGSATQNFVDLTTAQTIAGIKSFLSNIKYTGTSQILDASSGTTGYLYQYLANTGGGAYFAIERSTGGGLFTNSSAYATVLGSTTATSLQFATNGIVRASITSGGAVLVGTTSSGNAISSRGLVTVNGSSTVMYELQVGGSEYGYVYHGGSNGNMYFNNSRSNATTYVISLNNGVYLGTSATSWTANSDERLKNINGNIENAVDKLKTLRAVNFSWKSDESKKEVLGLIAQDVEKVFPQVIDKNKLPSKPEQKYSDETEYLGVRYTELIPVIVKAIQEMNTKLDEQNQTIQNLQEQINILSK